jgi:methylase of polypeptide subunit release factors
LSERLIDLENVDAEHLQKVAEKLRSIGYTEDTVRERLGLDDLASLRLESYPYYLNDRLRRRDKLDVAIILFLLQGVVQVEELDPILDKPSRKLLKEIGVLLGDRATRSYRSGLSLFPIRDRLFFTDHRFRHLPWIKSRAPRDPVMYLGADTYFLGRTTVRRRVRSCLDLCTGSGVHAVLAAAHAERVVGVDTNPRAVNFSRLNATLNGTWNAVFVEGDLFRPVGGERFDLILANPPFVPSPVYELHYRDGGPSGADILRRIIAAVPDYLAAGGIAQIVTHLGEREGESYLERVRRWLNGANLNLHVLKLGEDTVDQYAMAQARVPFGDDYGKYAAELKAWIDNLRAQRFHRVLGLVLTFEWNEEGANAPWTREDEAKPPRRAIGAEIARILLGKKRSRAPGALKALDRCRAGIPDDLLLVERRRTTGHGFETKDFRVSFKDSPITPELEIKPLIRDLLERVDNRATVPEIIARYARHTQARIEDVDEKCRRAFLAMLERGLVTLDEVSASAQPVEVSARGSDVVPADVLIGPPGAVPPPSDIVEAKKNLDPLAISGGEEPKVVAPWLGSGPAGAKVTAASIPIPHIPDEGGALDVLAKLAGDAAPAAPPAAPQAPPTPVDDEFGLADLDGIDDIKEDAPAP